jgi:hypothetical protein
MRAPFTGLCALRLALCALPLLPLPACRSTSIGTGPIYPADIAPTETIDIQVIRRGTRIALTNTTARALGSGTLWINGWYGHTTPSLAVGQSLNLNLRDFTDEYGDRFRAGGFFARERPDKIVLAELQTEGRLLGLVVIDQTDE